MNSFHELSQSELAAMSEETFEHYTAIALAEAGVIPADPPGERPVGIVLSEKKTYYTVSGSELLFATAADADKAASLAVGAIKSRYTRGYSSQKYVAKLCGDETDYPGEGFHKAGVSPVELPSYETLSAAIGALSDSESQMEEWKKRNEAFDAFNKKRQEIRDELWRVRSAAIDAKSDADRILETRERYLQLADGDEKIAERFLRKAFSATQISEAEELLGLDTGALAAPTEAPDLDEAGNIEAGVI